MIGPRPGRGNVPASCAQQRMWFLEQLDGPSALYNIAKAWRIQGALDQSALQWALNEIVRRHEVLRTNLRPVDGQPFQFIAPSATVPLEERRFEGLAAEQRLDAARAFIEESARRPFHLESDVLMRACLACLNASESILLIVQHHIASDGWSLGILAQELSTHYEAALDGSPTALAELSLQYSDYSEWQSNWLNSGAAACSLDFWKRRLAGTPNLGLAADFPRSNAPGPSGDRESFRIPPHLVASVSRMAQAQGATSFMVLLAAWLAVLIRHTGREDIAVGTAIAGRLKPELEPLIGLFVNTLVLRIPVAGNVDFQSLVESVKERCLEGFSHQTVPFEKIVEFVQPERNPGSTPFFQTLFALQSAPAFPLRLGGVAALPEPVSTRTAKAELSLLIEPEGQALLAELEYSTELFGRETIRRLSTHYLRALAFFTEQPRKRIFDAPLLSPAERRQVLLYSNGPVRDYPQSSIAAVFERQAAASSDAAAVSSSSCEWSYSELNERANRIAHALLQSGAVPGTPVGLLLDRSPLSVAAMLGVLKIGAGYLPLSPSDPGRHLIFQIEDSGVSAVLGCASTLPLFESLGLALPWVSADSPELERQSGANPGIPASPGDLAYINYTSGSTGKPKAVRIPHRGVLRLLFGQDYAHFAPDEVFLHFATLSFDAATLEVWAPLLHGGRCAVWEGELSSMRELRDFLQRQSVTSAWLTSSLFNVVLDEQPEALRGLRQVLTGGEALSLAHIRRAAELLPETRIVNGYGPTESTTFACCFTIPRPLPPHWPSIPIGRPIANTQVYILDSHLQLAPLGVPGELWIGGDGLALGYLNSPELNERKFADVDVDGRPRRLYRTGDRARWLPEGILEFLGRLDHQVKVRGFRVELGEIEVVLAAHPLVRAACVLPVPDAGGSARVEAFVARRPESSLRAADLAAHLADRLPSFMVPAAIRVLDDLPLTASGKADRQALAMLEPPAPPRQETANPLETRLARVWAETMSLAPDAVDRNRSFFELGGHSLLAMRLLARVEKEFGVRLPVTSLFQASTITSMASSIQRRAQTTAPIFPIQPEGTLPPFYSVGAGPLFWDFASLLPNRPFLGLAMPVNSLTSGRKLEDVAGAMVAAIRDRQPQGPYVLGGWCLAGVLAFEVARQLECEGAQVQLVVLFDSPNPAVRRAWFAPAPRRRWLQLMALKTGYHLSEMLRMSSRSRRGYLAARARGFIEHWMRLTRRSPGAAGLDVPLDYQAAFGELSYAYTPRPIRAPVLQVRPVHRIRGGWFSDGFGWENATPRLEIVEVAGNHVAMLRAPHVAAVAGLISRRLAEP